MRRLTSDCLGGGLVCDDACLGLLALKMMARDHPGFVGTQMTASLKEALKEELVAAAADARKEALAEAEAGA